MSEVKIGRGTLSAWRPAKHKKNSNRKESFRKNQGIKGQELINLVSMWLHETAVTTTVPMLGNFRTTVFQWYTCLRNTSSHHLVENIFYIRGAGSLLQIEESYISKRKNNRGCLIPEKWVLDGMDVSSKQGFL